MTPMFCKDVESGGKVRDFYGEVAVGVLIGWRFLGQIRGFPLLWGSIFCSGNPVELVETMGSHGKVLLSCLQIFWEADIQRTLAEVDQYQFL